MKLVGGALFNIGASVAPTNVRTGMALGNPMLGKLFKSNDGAPRVPVGDAIFSVSVRKCLLHETPVPNKESAFEFCGEAIYVFAKIKANTNSSKSVPTTT